MINMNLGIVGSRNFTDYESFKNAITKAKNKKIPIKVLYIN